jgi:hypothetical protein
MRGAQAIAARPNAVRLLEFLPEVLESSILIPDVFGASERTLGLPGCCLNFMQLQYRASAVGRDRQPSEMGKLRATYE